MPLLGAIVHLFLLPTVLRRGVLDGFIQGKIAGALGGSVTFSHIDLPSPSVLRITNIEVGAVEPFLQGVRVADVEILFSGPFPLGEVREIRCRRPSVRLIIKSKTLLKLGESSDRPSGFEWGFLGAFKPPRVEIREGEVVGMFGKEPFGITSLAGALERGTEGDFPFRMNGKVLSTVSAPFVLAGSLGGGKLLQITECRVDQFRATAQLEADVPSTVTLQVKVQPLPITRPLQSLCEEWMGPVPAGSLEMKSQARFERGSLKSLECGGVFSKESRREEIRFKGKVDAEKEGYGVQIELEKTVLGTGEEGLLRAQTMVVRAKIATNDGGIRGDAAVGQIRYAQDEMEVSLAKAAVRFSGRKTQRGVYEGQVHAQFGGLEVVLGEKFYNLSDTGLTVDVEGDIDSERQTAEIHAASLTLDGIGRIHARGVLQKKHSGYEYRGDIGSGDLNLSKILAKLSEAYEIDPLFGEGTVRGELRLSGDGSSVEVHGRFSMHAPRAAYRDVRVENLRMDIPIIVHRGGEPEGAHRKEGFLSWDRLTAPYLVLDRQRMAVYATPGVLTIDKGLKARLAEGLVQMGEIVLDGGGTDVTARTSARIEEVRLETLGAVVGVKRPFRPDDVIQGDFLKIEYVRNTCFLRGSVHARAFGGHVTVQEIHVRDVGTASMAYRFQFGVEDIHLRRACETFTEFGVISGWIDGHGWMELSSEGIPVEFEMVFKDDATISGARKLNVKAAVALLQLAEGSSASATPKLPGVVKSLHFRRLGFYARLRRFPRLLTLRGFYYRPRWGGEIGEYDIEQLRTGVTKRDAVEYIMVGSGLHQINIKQLQPQARLPFELLVERLKGLHEE